MLRSMRVTVMPIVVGRLGTVPKSFKKGLVELETRNWDHPGDSIKIDFHTQKSPGDLLRRHDITQTPEKDHQLELA